jgi:hypothetical protein
MAAEAVAGWLAVVDDDLRQVVNNLHGPMPSLSGAAYHCQQAAEKLVKAVLVEANIAFPKTTTSQRWSVCCRLAIASKANCGVSRN